MANLVVSKVAVAAAPDECVSVAFHIEPPYNTKSFFL